MFFQDINGCRYPLSRIEMIGKDHRAYHYKDRAQQPTTVGISLGNNKSVEVSFYELDRITNLPTQTIPSQPDYYILGYDEEDEKLEIWKTLIIGWSVSSDGQMIPITVDGLNDGVSEAGPVLSPDGKVTELGSRTWESLDNFRRSKIDERLQRNTKAANAI